MNATKHNKSNSISTLYVRKPDSRTRMKAFLLLLISFSSTMAFSQPFNDSTIKEDTTGILYSFQNGTVSGHFRYFFMATDNTETLSDYYAHAVGGGLKYETSPFHHFKAGISGFFVYNAGSSDLSKEDAQTHQLNRYEIGLFDIEDPHNKNDIDRLEELYLRYDSKKTHVTLGKQLINTPFINQQDSRMRPTEVGGVYGDITLRQKWKVEGGWLYQVSPRSTVKWYPVAQSIGINSQGVNRDGTAGHYKGNLASKGIGLLGITYKPAAGVQLKAFEQFADNLFTTSLVQAEFERPTGGKTFLAALQYIRQDVLNDGGNVDISRTYFDPSNKVEIFGARIGLKKAGWQATLNYTRIGKGGRFTMPREWGTEPFFTYLSRERNEGTGDVHAVMGMLKANLLKDQLKLEAGYGHYYVPKVENAALNKYGIPSYQHIKILADYEFHRTLKGFNLALLWVHKELLGNAETNLKYVLNKVNMTSYNLILNYHF
jgi:hypothetical protein